MKSSKFTQFLKYFILALSIAMIVAGALSGEAKSVLAKATHICLECIGIG